MPMGEGRRGPGAVVYLVLLVVGGTVSRLLLPKSVNHITADAAPPACDLQCGSDGNSACLPPLEHWQACGGGADDETLNWVTWKAFGRKNSTTEDIPTCREPEKRADVICPTLSQWPEATAEHAGWQESASSRAKAPLPKAVILTSVSYHHEVGAPLACLLRPFVGYLTYAYTVYDKAIDPTSLISTCPDAVHPFSRGKESTLAFDDVDLVVLLTATTDMMRFKHLMLPGRRHLWVIHHTETLAPLAQRALNLGLIEDVLFVVLGDHVLPAARKVLDDWVAETAAAAKRDGEKGPKIAAGLPRAAVIYPVAPLPPSVLFGGNSTWLAENLGAFYEENFAERFGAVENSRDATGTPERSVRTYVVAGSGSSDRRPYADIFDCFSDLASAGAEFRLVLAGTKVSGHAGSLPLPLQDPPNRVIFLDSAPYPEYFATMAAADFLVAAVAKEEYMWERATSSIPTAAMAGTPLLMEGDILALYPCLAAAPMHATVSGGAEGFCRAVQRAHALTDPELGALRAEVAACHREMVHGGLQVLAQLAARPPVSVNGSHS